MRGLRDSFGNQNWDIQCGIGMMASGERMSGPDLDGCASDALARYMPKFGGVASTSVWKAGLRNLDVYGCGSNSIAALDDGATSKPAPALFSRVMAPKPCPRGGNARRPVSNRSKHAGPVGIRRCNSWAWVQHGGTGWLCEPRMRRQPMNSAVSGVWNDHG